MVASRNVVLSAGIWWVSVASVRRVARVVRRFVVSVWFAVSRVFMVVFSRVVSGCVMVVRWGFMRLANTGAFGRCVSILSRYRTSSVWVSSGVFGCLSVG